jgi:predicted ester cyclase
MTEQKSNLEILAEYTRRMLRGDMQAVYDTWAPDFFTHVAARVSPEAVGMDQRPGEVMFWEESAKAFPDRRFVVHKLWEVDGGETVICHYSMTGTHSGGSFFGAPPTGKQVEINGTAILRFKNGKIVEHWGGPHCMYGIGLLNVAEPPTKPRLTPLQPHRESGSGLRADKQG